MIRQHRAALQVKAAAQRAEMAELVQPWRAPFRFADWVVALTRLARTQPLAITLLMGLLMRLECVGWAFVVGLAHLSNFYRYALERPFLISKTIRCWIRGA
jgi:hypothetical protein